MRIHVIYLLWTNWVVKTMIRNGVAMCSLSVESLFGQLNPPTLLRRPFLGHSETWNMFSIPPKVSKRPGCCWNFLVYWRRGQVVVTHEWHLCLLLLALGLSHLTEAVAELPKTEDV